MRTALIVGAGIGGLASGLALRRAGWNIRIVERAASPQELGFDLMLASNAMAALRELGIADVVLAAGVAIDSASLKVGRHGRVRRIDLAPVPPAVRAVIASRQALHGALLDAVGVETIAFSAEAARFQAADDSVRLQLLDGRVMSGDILIGADGVGSVIQRMLWPEAVPRASGLIGLRGLAHGVDALLDAGLAMMFIPGADSGLIRGREGVYWFVSAREQLVTDQGQERRRLVEKYTQLFGDPFRSIVRATRDDEMRLETLTDREPGGAWGRDRVTLLGDAAHPMLPHAGQGAAQALEDAVALGLTLRDADEPIVALRRYEAARAARTARIVRLSRRLSRLRTTENAALASALGVAVRLFPTAALHLTKLVRPRDPHAHLRS